MWPCWEIIPDLKLPPGLGGRPDMEWDQAAVGRWVEGVRERHVERCRLHHQLPLRRHHRTQIACLLWRELRISFLVGALFLCCTNHIYAPSSFLARGEREMRDLLSNGLIAGITYLIFQTTYFQFVNNKKLTFQRFHCQYHFQCKFPRNTYLSFFGTSEEREYFQQD